MEIYRSILKDLAAWKDSRFRKPLVLQGARQVGKSWVLNKDSVSLWYFRVQGR